MKALFQRDVSVSVPLPLIKEPKDDEYSDDINNSSPASPSSSDHEQKPGFVQRLSNNVMMKRYKSAQDTQFLQMGIVDHDGNIHQMNKAVSA